MKAIRLKGTVGLERLTVVELDEPGAPQQGEILVRLHASSLNYHDYLVALGKIPTADGLIPLSDGAESPAPPLLLSINYVRVP